MAELLSNVRTLSQNQFTDASVRAEACRDRSGYRAEALPVSHRFEYGYALRHSDPSVRPGVVPRRHRRRTERSATEWEDRDALAPLLM